MTTLADRMREALAYRESIADPGEPVSQASLARACGIKQPSVNAWFSGDTKSLRGDGLVRAANYLRVSSSWLSSGAGTMLPAPATATGAATESGADTARGVASVGIPIRAGRRIPVVGHARLGDNGHFVELEHPVGHGDGYIDLPTADPNAYALRDVRRAY